MVHGLLNVFVVKCSKIDFAAQPYSSIALSVFIPLILENLAWAAGTSSPNDPTHPHCADRSQLTSQQINSLQCFLNIGGWYLRPVSFSLFVSSMSVALQVITYIRCVGILFH